MGICGDGLYFGVCCQALNSPPPGSEATMTHIENIKQNVHCKVAVSENVPNGNINEFIAESLQDDMDCRVPGWYRFMGCHTLYIFPECYTGIVVYMYISIYIVTQY